MNEKTERKLQYFAETLRHDAEIKKQQAKTRQATDLRKTFDEAVASEIINNNAKIKVAKEELARNANRKISQAKVQAISQYVQTRKQHIDKLFVEVEAALAGFTQTSEYEGYILECIQKARQSGDFFIIKLSPHDTRFSDAIKAATGLSPEEGNHDYIGGFALLNESRTILADHTFKTKISLAKREFAYDK